MINFPLDVPPSESSGNSAVVTESSDLQSCHSSVSLADDGRGEGGGEQFGVLSVASLLDQPLVHVLLLSRPSAL